MEFKDYLLYKALGLVALSFIVNLVYAAFTGRSIAEARRDKHSVPPDQQEH
jgi:hypothetical protein